MIATDEELGPRFDRAIDLAARRLGGMVLEATDEFFAPKENLLEPAAPVFDPAAYSDRGKVMDGWETRRRRGEGTDSCIVRLGVPGVIETAITDTTNFRGNAPAACWFEGCVTDGGPPDDDTEWFPLLERTALRPHAWQALTIEDAPLVTHVRFGIIPDGGVARLRLLGRPLPDLHAAVCPNDRADLAAALNGGRAVACSDEFFSSPHNLVAVGDARTMADGWETRRRRGPGDDWAIIELATTGTLDRVELDTTNFKGNHPDRCVVEGVHAPGADVADLADDGWVELVGPTRMQPHARHTSRVDTSHGPVSHLRLRVIPDGGVARLRAYGTIDDDGWRRHGLARLNARQHTRAYRDLLACCGSGAWARTVTDLRPFADPADLLAAADRVWNELGPDDHLEAFAAHPRIGERAQARWSSQEQSGTASASAATLRQLEEGNHRYEDRFGHVFLICATGLSADEMLIALDTRIDNDPVTERQVAAEEQRKITRLRLDRLLREGRSG